MQLKSVRAYSPWPMFFVLVLAFRPFLARKSVLSLQVSHTSAGTWNILPGGRNLLKLRFSFRGKLRYLGKTHGIHYSQKDVLIHPY